MNKKGYIMGTKKSVKTKAAPVVRVCDDCGKSGVIDTDIWRVCRQVSGKKTFIWRCKPECKK